MAKKAQHLLLNRVTGEYKVDNRVITGKEFWYAAKRLIIKADLAGVPCKIQDDKFILMYQL